MTISKKIFIAGIVVIAGMPIANSYIYKHDPALEKIVNDRFSDYFSSVELKNLRPLGTDLHEYELSDGTKARIIGQRGGVFISAPDIKISKIESKDTYSVHYRSTFGEQTSTLVKQVTSLVSEIKPLYEIGLSPNEAALKRSLRAVPNTGEASKLEQ